MALSLFNRNLEYFLACAKAPSLNEAAFKLGMTQASLSIALKKLETDLGTVLFERDRRGIRLTPKGHALFEKLTAHQRVISKDIFESIGQAETAPIRIGCVAHFANRHLLPALDRLKPALPGIHLFLGFSLNVYRAVLDGRLDFGFIGWTTQPKGVQFTAIRRDPVAIVGLQSRFGHIKRARSMADLRNEPWVYQPKPQYDWAGHFDPMRAGQVVYVVDNYVSFRHLILDGRAIGTAQLEFFNEPELRLLAKAPVLPEATVTIYAISRQSLRSSEKEVLERLIALTKA